MARRYQPTLVGAVLPVPTKVGNYQKQVPARRALWVAPGHARRAQRQPLRYWPV